ncbi:MAG: Hsp33 family molecular chaperone HslO [Lachnospiraceae bacterium]|nr:Hsp33 family molecular chaperone HslO [Lachnospiraceae bacterium]
MNNKDKSQVASADHMVRATAANGELRAFACETTNMVEKARRIHNTSPVVTAALGRLLTASSMMGSMMKGEKDLLTLNINGDGPAGALCVTADSSGNAKGFVQHPMVILPANSKGKLDVSGALGKGVLNVIRDTGLKEPYNSSTELVSGEVAEDITYYFAVSEQVPSSVGLGVLMNKSNYVQKAGGFIIQVMPGASEETISKLEAALGNVTSVTSMLDSGLTPTGMLETILADFNVTVLDTIYPKYTCDCSREKVEKAILSAGRKEIESMILEGKPIFTSCRFCGKQYSFSILELEELLKSQED